MERFTKGPWHAKGFGELNNLVCNVTQDISVYSDDAASGKAESDAYLIAAAPQMYAELIDAKTGFEFIIENSLVNTIYFPAIHQQIESIKSLLAKARGEK